jgi:hypothetical protein
MGPLTHPKEVNALIIEHIEGRGKPREASRRLNANVL